MAMTRTPHRSSRDACLDTDPAPEELEVQAQALAREAEALGPAGTLRAAHAYLRRIDKSLASATRDHHPRPLHRAASTTALTIAHASRWCGLDGNGWLRLAEQRAAAAGDGPLLASAWLSRGTAVGESARSADCPSPEAMKHYIAALDRAGSAHAQAGLRASARFMLAWQLAAAGREHAAHLELGAARCDAERAGWPMPRIESNAGSALRKLGWLQEAEMELSGALDTPPIRRTAVLCDLAHTYVAVGDADTAAEALEEAFVLARADGMESRLPRIVTAKSLLPPGRATRQLDEVMRSV
jgi:tetratricopeptide (TPR) repeat protein